MQGLVKSIDDLQFFPELIIWPAGPCIANLSHHSVRDQGQQGPQHLPGCRQQETLCSTARPCIAILWPKGGSTRF